MQKLAIILGTIFLLSTAVSTQSYTSNNSQTTPTMFSFTVTLYPTYWTASMTNLGPSTFSNQIGILNSSIEDNVALTTKSGSQYIASGQTLTGSFNYKLSSGSTYSFCAQALDNTGKTAFDSLLACVAVIDNGKTVTGSSKPGINLSWKTSIVGGATSKWDLTIKNNGMKTVTFTSDVVWTCKYPDQTWGTCTESTQSMNLIRGASHTFNISFKPQWNSMPAGKTGLTISVWANYGNQWTLDEQEFNIVAS